MLTIHRPNVDELYSYYKTYLKYVPEDDILQAFIKQKDTTRNFLKSISEEKGSSAYADGKWLLKEVVGHLCDTERILSYRALRISRNDKTPLPGFDENTYTPNANFGPRKLANVSDEFKAVRESSIALFGNMSEEMFSRRGTTNNVDVSVRDILYFILAHERHHLGVIKERYLL